MPPPSAHEATPLIGKENCDLADSQGSAAPHKDKLRGVAKIVAWSNRVNDMVRHHTGSIGMLGSISIAVNSLTGPAMLNLPATYEKSGLIPTTACIVLVCILSSLCALHMANVISKVPGNHNFKREIEFSEAFREYLGINWYYATEIMFFCCITCLNISSIVDTAQVIDSFLGHWSPYGTGALQVLSNTTHFIHWDASGCTKEVLANGECVPFDIDDGLVITAGNILVTVIFLPLALMDLKENAAWQVLGVTILIVTSIQFIIQFGLSGIHMSDIPLWGTNWDDLFGVVLFNFALVIAIPAWLYERESHVDVPTVIYGSTGLSMILYVTIGILGNMAMPHVSQNMLESMMSGAFGTLMQLSASIFAFAIIGLGIPLFSVLTRLNLTGSGLCSAAVGNALAVYFPFAVSLLLYDGAAIVMLLSWGGTVFTSFVAFILPIVLALHVVQNYDYDGYVSVYNGLWEQKKAHVTSLRVLLFVTIASVLAALAGNFF